MCQFGDAYLKSLAGRKVCGGQATYLNLRICPSRNLNHHVQDGLLLICKERNVVERRNRNAILLDVDAVIQSVRSSDLSGLVLRSHAGLGSG